MILYQIYFLISLVFSANGYYEYVWQEGTGTIEELLDYVNLGRQAFHAMQDDTNMTFLDDIRNIMGEPLADKVDIGFRVNENRINVVQREFSIKFSYDMLWLGFGTFADNKSETNRLAFIQICQTEGVDKILSGVWGYIESYSDSFFMTQNKKLHYSYIKFTDISEMMLGLLHVVFNVRSFCYGLEGLTEETQKDAMNKLGRFIGQKDSIAKQIQYIEGIQTLMFWKNDSAIENFVCETLSNIEAIDLPTISQQLLDKVQENYNGYGFNFAVIVARSLNGTKRHGLVDETYKPSRSIDMENGVKKSDHFVFIPMRYCKSDERPIEIVVSKSPKGRKSENAKRSYAKQAQGRIVTELREHAFMPSSIGWSVAAATENVRMDFFKNVPTCTHHFITTVDDNYGVGFNRDSKSKQYKSNFTDNHYVHRTFHNFTIYSIC